MLISTTISSQFVDLDVSLGAWLALLAVIARNVDDRSLSPS